MQHLYSLEGLITFGLLVGVIYGPWQWACTDAARQSLFFLRDQLFDIARTGRLEFASDEYRDVRDVFDLQIRFAHALSFVRLLVFARMARRVATRPNRARQAIDRISDLSTRAEVSELVDKLDQTVILMMVGKSPLLTIITLLAAIIVIPIQALQKFIRQPRIDLIRKTDITHLLRFPTTQIAPLIHEEAAAFKS